MCKPQSPGLGGTVQLCHLGASVIVLVGTGQKVKSIHFPLPFYNLDTGFWVSAVHIAARHHITPPIAPT